MTTEVILTGTGVPHPSPGRAGPGTLVRSGPFLLQFDAGRAIRASGFTGRVTVGTDLDRIAVGG